MIFAIILYADMGSIFSVDKIVECCTRDLCFIWLAQGQQPKRDVLMTAYQLILWRIYIISLSVVYTQKVIACQSCEGCEYKSQCLYQYDPQKDSDKNKLMKVNERWDELKRWSEANVLSEKGIRYRQIRSVETEGSFGDMKENDQFRRFHRRGTEKVTKEMMLYAFARNVNKYYRFEEK